jgi:succinate-semialdehyde dehydrogenase/glutarate-semialdehyde dehydrogenase
MNEHVQPRRIELLVGSEWRAGKGGAPLTLTSPATGAVIAEVQQGTAADVDAAVLKAEAALPVLAKMTAFERAALCHKVADVIASRREEFARDISLEQGKVYHSEALGEVDAAILMHRDSAECATRLEGKTYQSVDPGRRIMTVRQPRGVYGIITPWNFPLTIPSEYIAAGLATGNAMVWKPSEWTPLTSRNLMQAYLDAGVPPGTLNLMLGAPAEVGAAVAGHHGIVAIGLTGSTRTGLAVAKLAAGKPMLLELGGNGPTIVFEDSDVERAAAVVGAGAFANAGQICNSTERILVQRKVHDRFVEALVAAAKNVRLGSPFDATSTMGPVSNAPTASKVDSHMADARLKGATIHHGGERATGLPTDLYYQPTIISGVTTDMLLNREETFGPVAPVLTFEDEDDAIRIAETCPLGLHGSIWTNGVARALRMSERLRCGTVHVNETSAYWQLHTPTGGFTGTGSGIGRIGGMATLEEMTQLKTISLNVVGT